MRRLARTFLCGLCGLCGSIFNLAKQLPTESHAVLCHCGQTYPRLPAGGLDFLQGGELPDFDLDEDDFRRRAILEQEAEGIAGRMDNLIIPMIRRYAFWAGKTFGGDNGLASAIDFR